MSKKTNIRKYTTIAVAIAIGATLIASVIVLTNAGVPYDEIITDQPVTRAKQTQGSGRPTISGEDIRLIIGDPNAPKTIIEYADFKCPRCNELHRKAGSQLRSNEIAKGEVNIDFRAYPLWKDSSGALKGAYCANKQGKFVSYHDTLYDYMWQNYYKAGNNAAEIEPILSRSVLTGIAQSVQLNTTQFNTCLDDKTMDVHIDNDLILAADDEVQGTPTLIIGNQKIVGVQPYSNLQKLIKL